MERENEQLSPLDLGSATEETLGRDGKFSDLVAEIPPTGISDE